ncbi:unnamed protein product [Cylicostephanus goldi]|uniref:Uncharacterized protein n=1 Tax=Cylicostephanus goldi TaxID=71465 RepID=A0A3P6Q3H8_CYLGO|nr:unnamed protein product [Cylicostephanus goldi]
MEDDPPKAQFFFAESDEDSLGLVESKSDLSQTVPDPSKDGGAAGGSSFPTEEQAELPNFSENAQSEHIEGASASFENTQGGHYLSEDFWFILATFCAIFYLKHDDEIPAQVSGTAENSAGPAGQETCDVPTVLTDDGSNGSPGVADGEVPAEPHEHATFPQTASEVSFAQCGFLFGFQ